MMSYRGGQRRDNNRSNNGGGYGGGLGAGSVTGVNRRQNYGGGNHVNPWQGGGNSNAGHMGNVGILPRAQQSSVLSSLSTPEAQLAMATNLLNKILSPQQNASNVPSLLSLPTRMNNGLSYGDYRSRSSFADRHRDRPGDRRMQPYNKSGLIRRGTDEKSRLGKPRFSDKFSSTKPKKRDTDNEGDKQNGDASEDKEKRGEDDADKEEEKVLGAKYEGVPNSMLSCHVCHKNMWDACSFEKHVSGRRHQMMMEKLDETYKIKVELLRHEQRSAESQRELEIERLERQGKKIFYNMREYCIMCDLHFYGKLISHRKKDRHQKLKSFLHPKCYLCHKEFPNRLEWDDHKLSAAHMLKVVAYYNSTRPSVKQEEMDVNDIESLDGEDVSVFDELVDNVKKETKKLNVDINEFPVSVEDYNLDDPIGSEYVVNVKGHLCKLCKKFVGSDEEAAVHARTLSHYKNYAALVKMKVKADKEKEAAEKAAEHKAKRESFKKKFKGKDEEEEDTDVKDVVVKMEDGGEGEGQEIDGDANDKESEEVPKVVEAEEAAEVKMEVDSSAEAAVAAAAPVEVKVEEDESTTRGRRGRPVRARRGK